MRLIVCFIAVVTLSSPARAAPDYAEMTHALADGGDIRFLSNGAMDRPMRHYTGSISFDSSGTLLAVSAPRGDRVGLWDVCTGTPAGLIAATDASGIAPMTRAGDFMIAGGDGALRRGSADRASVLLRPADGRVRWDNHLTAL